MAPFRIGGPLVRGVRWCGSGVVEVEVWLGSAEAPAVVVVGSSVETRTLVVAERTAVRLRVGDDGWLAIAVPQLAAAEPGAGGVWIALRE